MTKEEALRILTDPDRIGISIIRANDAETQEYNSKSIIALDMAIKALEKADYIEDKENKQ